MNFIYQNWRPYFEGKLKLKDLLWEFDLLFIYNEYNKKNGQKFPLNSLKPKIITNKC
jgi:hypothetical protein